MNVILIIGGSGGIGEAFAKRFHSMGKRVIVTGRNESKLNELKANHKGVESYIMDMTDIAALPKHVETLTQQYPDIDTVWVNGGIQYSFKFADPTTSSDDSIRSEIDTNVTAPMILARHFVPFLLNKGTTTNFMITSSGLAYIPMGIYPVYCPTKAFVHHFLVGLRQQVKGTKLNIIEIAPPRVETNLEARHGADSEVPAFTLQDYTNQTFEILDKNRAEDLKEVGIGIAAMGIQAWRGSIGGILEKIKVGG